MVVTSVLFFAVARQRWGWSLLRATSLVALFLVVDLSFFGANLAKIPDGGWLPLLLGVAFFTLMTTWKAGHDRLERHLTADAVPVAVFLQEVARTNAARVGGTAVVFTPSLDVVPPVLLLFFRHAHVRHEHVILLHVVTRDIPEVAAGNCVSLVADLSGGFVAMRAEFGFMQPPIIPGALCASDAYRAYADPERTTYFLGRAALHIGSAPGMALWRKVLFAYLFRNAVPSSALFGLPQQQLLELRTDTAL